MATSATVSPPTTASTRRLWAILGLCHHRAGLRPLPVHAARAARLGAGRLPGSPADDRRHHRGLGSTAAVTSVFFQWAGSGFGPAMTTSLIVVVALTAITVPAVTLMPRRAPEELQH